MAANKIFQCLHEAELISLRRWLTTQNEGCERPSPDNLGLQPVGTQILLLLSILCCLLLTWGCTSILFKVHYFIKKGKYTDFLHRATSLTPEGSYMPRASKQNTFLTTNSQSAEELPKEKNERKKKKNNSNEKKQNKTKNNLRVAFLSLNLSFSRSISQSCSNENLFYCAEETHQSYGEKTVLSIGHNIW